VGKYRDYSNEKIYRIIIDTACQQEEDYAHAQQAKAPPQAKPE